MTMTTIVVPRCHRCDAQVHKPFVHRFVEGQFPLNVDWAQTEYTCRKCYDEEEAVLMAIDGTDDEAELLAMIE